MNYIEEKGKSIADDAKQELAEAIENPSTDGSIAILSKYYALTKWGCTFGKKNSCIHAAGFCAMSE